MGASKMASYLGLVGRLALRCALALPLMIAAPVSGCSAAAREADMHILAIRVVDYHDQHEMPVPHAAGFEELIGRKALANAPAQMLSKTETERPHRLLLRIEFDSTVDLWEVARKDSVVFLHSYFCANPDNFAVISSPTVYSNGEPIRPSKTLDRSDATKQEKKYYFYANVARQESPLSNPPQRAFNLRTNPEDVCFYITGSSGIAGRTYKSGVARIARAEVE